MFQNSLTLKNYERLRTKFSTQVAGGLFNVDEFIRDMKPFFDDRERKYKAYTNEKNEIDRRPKPATVIIKINSKLHAGFYSAAVDQAAGHFTSIPIK